MQKMHSRSGHYEQIYVTAQKLVNSFIELDILKQEDDKQRNKTFVLWKYLNILDKDIID